jgi:hypothetical protein
VVLDVVVRPPRQLRGDRCPPAAEQPRHITYDQWLSIIPRHRQAGLLIIDLLTL